MGEYLITKIYNQLTNEFHKNNGLEKKEVFDKNIGQMITDLKRLILPEFFNNEGLSQNDLSIVQRKIQDVMKFEKRNIDLAVNDSFYFIEKLPHIRDRVKGDIEAAYKKDPAAKSYEEIALAYPGLFALMVHRISYEINKMGYHLFARLLSEYSHGKTGIDIHPGAEIGSSFFMDHGTGIVIGETTIIGNHVTIYQNVTLGAFSFDRDENGDLIKGNKRHPTIEDNVTIYAGATILGGNTVIGRNSIIGGNVWLTESVISNSKVIKKFENRIGTI